jgi:uncharacterized membrane protein YkvA (DUF1232 family)
MTFVPGILAQLDGFDEQMRAEIEGWLASEAGRSYRFGAQLRMVPDFLRLIVRLLVDDRVPSDGRALLVAALVSVLSPADFLPESLMGPVGYEDDLLVMALVLYEVISRVSAQVVLESWQRDENLLGLVRSVLDNAEEMVGPRLWHRLRDWVGVQWAD